jgi:hypothetical protein
MRNAAGPGVIRAPYRLILLGPQSTIPEMSGITPVQSGYTTGTPDFAYRMQGLSLG